MRRVELPSEWMWRAVSQLGLGLALEMRAVGAEVMRSAMYRGASCTPSQPHERIVFMDAEAISIRLRALLLKKPR